MKRSPSRNKLRKLSPRSSVLSGWRGVGDWDELEGRIRVADRTPETILPGVWKDLRIEQRMAEGQIRTIWEQVIDPRVAVHAQPVGLVKGTLFVEVDSNAWLSEIVRYHRHEILERLQHAVGKGMIQKISFRCR